MSPNSVSSTATANARRITKITTKQIGIVNKTQPAIMQEKKINRSNSLVNTALKWIPLLNQHYNHNNGGGGNGVDGTGGTLKQFGSTVAVQKLRESKWFNSDEQRIFCAVIECGFIVEIRGEQNSASSSTVSDEENYNNDDTLDKINNEIKLQQILAPSTSKLIENYDSDQIFTNSHSTTTSTTNSNSSWFGVVLCKTLKDNKPKPDTIEIFSVKIRQNGVRVYKTTLETIWNNNWQIRINNFADREKTPHNEKDIRNQISFARKARYSLWHNSKHFAYWCRYGSRQQDVRKRQMSECVKWGSVGMNAGMLLIMNNRQRSYTTSK